MVPSAATAKLCQDLAPSARITARCAAPAEFAPVKRTYHVAFPAGAVSVTAPSEPRGAAPGASYYASSGASYYASSGASYYASSGRDRGAAPDYRYGST